MLPEKADVDITGMMKKPNVVLIYVDNQPAKMLGCAGNDEYDGRKTIDTIHHVEGVDNPQG